MMRRGQYQQIGVIVFFVVAFVGLIASFNPVGPGSVNPGGTNGTDDAAPTDFNRGGIIGQFFSIVDAVGNLNIPIPILGVALVTALVAVAAYAAAELIPLIGG